jgi:6-phosphogluconolactonase
MAIYLYVAAVDSNKISAFSMDGSTGKLTPQADVPVSGGPSLLAISPDRNVIYVGHRNEPEISSYRIDYATGGLSQTGSVTPDDAPGFMATDRTGRHLMVSYYGTGHVGVHPTGDGGDIAGPPTEWLATEVGAHAIQTDRSNKFAFVPHIDRLMDDVLSPPKNLPGPNTIYQFRFDENTGRLTPNTPQQVDVGAGLGPRHYVFHPSLDVVYFSDEQGNSVTGYRLDTTTGTLSAFQTITTLPEGHTERNTTSQIQLTPSGNLLFVPNRGHNSIASFSVDPSTGQLTAAGRVPTESVPSAFGLDPAGQFVYAAGSASAKLASYRIDTATGGLTPMEIYPVGDRPMSVLATQGGN